MIPYEIFIRLRQLRAQGWKLRQIGRELGLNFKTVKRWSQRTEYHFSRRSKRASLLDAYRAEVIRLLNQHPFSARQIFQRLQEQGYTGGYSILKELVGEVRPKRTTAFLTLHFRPGECAQLDWGYAGLVRVGNTQRRLSFLVVVLGYSRQLYVEFTLGEAMDQFLSGQQNAFAYFGGVPRYLMIDNLKTAVLSHPYGQPALFHRRYLDFARHYGFEIRACNVRAAHEKGQVENAVGYVRKSFLNGLELCAFAPLNPAVRRWLEEIANVRVHGQTRQKPAELFKVERPQLQSLPATLYDVGQVYAVHATRRCRVHFQSNHYSVPAEYAGSRLTLRVYPQRLVIFAQDRLVAEHVRCYERNRDFENPDHIRQLLQVRRRARDQKLLQRFLQLSPQAEEYYLQIQQRRFNPFQHVAKIVALSEIYGHEATARALGDACEFQAFSAEYITNLLEQRRRLLPEPSPLHLTCSQDLLELELPPPNLTVYENLQPQNPHEKTP
jgi:transposase